MGKQIGNTPPPLASMQERFKWLISQLVERGELTPNSREKGYSHFAERVFGNKQYGHLLDKFMKDERSFPLKHATRFCEVYGISYDYLVHGGNNHPFKATNYNLENTDGAAYSPQANILYSSMSAFASLAVDVSVYEESEKFYIPGLQGEFIAFNIKGNSMSPTIADGDMVICRIMETGEPIHDNEIYAIVQGNSVMVKRIQKIRGKNNELVKLKLISDNYLEHDPFIIPITDVRRLLKVERRVTGL